MTAGCLTGESGEQTGNKLKKGRIKRRNRKIQTGSKPKIGLWIRKNE